MKIRSVVLYLLSIALLTFTGAQDENPRDGVLAPEPIPESMFPLTEEPATLRVAAV